MQKQPKFSYNNGGDGPFPANKFCRSGKSFLDELYEEIDISIYTRNKPAKPAPQSIKLPQIQSKKLPATSASQAAGHLPAAPAEPDNFNATFAYFDISSLFDEKPAYRFHKEINRTPAGSLRSLEKLAPSLPLSRIHLAAFACLATVVSLSLTMLPFKRDKAELPNAAISRIMYQNVDAKVASFRRELSEGRYYMNRRYHAIKYTAQSGDTVDKLSRKFHIKPETIIKNNQPITEKTREIKVGTKLTILPVDGIIHPVEKTETVGEISERYDVPLKEIIKTNTISDPNRIAENQQLIIPGADNLKTKPKTKSIQEPGEGDERSRNSLQARFFGSKKNNAPAASRRGFVWPTRGTVTSHYGWRWGTVHAGMDIAASYGTPIRASRSGVVVQAGWMGGYGYAIDIDHGNGVITRYGHCSRLYVQNRQFVGQGEVIAAMGSTGHSTGPHLHFEVRINGSAINPQAYL